MAETIRNTKDAGITSYCDERVWCIDVGLAAHYGGDLQVLEILGDQVRALELQR